MTITFHMFALLLLVLSSVSARRDNGFIVSEKKMSVETRLYGGTAVTDVNAYPYVVAITDISSGNPSPFGQAVIISKYFALTSGYVSYTISTTAYTKYRVVSNTLDVTSLTGGVQHQIKKAFSHPEYPATMYQYLNNLGLVKVCPGFLTSSFAVLPPAGFTLDPGSPAVLVGWGENLSTLRDLNVILDSTENCSTTAIINNIRPFDDAFDSCIAADQGKYTCLMDDGVGLFSGVTVIGIQSMGGCNSNLRDTQTRVAAFTPWIQYSIGV